MAPEKQVIHEVDFCSQVSSALNILISRDQSLAPINEARVEGYGKGTSSRQRKDLRFYDTQGKLILCGEVKFPGTPDGRSAYDDKLCRDAEQKADNAGIRYFFTWNVNTFVLWDRSLWDRPLLERRVQEWRLERNLMNAEAVSREENLKHLKDRFLPDLFREVAAIISGRRPDWALPPDDIFIRTLESHLDWPVQLLSSYVLEQADRSKAFGLRVEQWMSDHDWPFVRSPQEEWVTAVDNMAKTLAYVWANRIIFYKALLARFSDLPRMELRPSIKTPEQAVAFFNRLFERAVERSGDYEPLLMPEAKDWATALIFRPPSALVAWRGLLRGIEPINFHDVPSDVVGRIFQKLIGPEERHRYGQHFTGDDVVDLINGFSIHNSQDVILDPACGSGSFLVRAYYRKRTMDPGRSHPNLIGELFGCDIAMYPAHLATLNLAAREINEEANYPRICRRDFFDFVPDRPFCIIPGDSSQSIPVPLPPLDAVVGNPPYVRQEKIEKKDKAHYGELVNTAWPDLELSGRSDLHCYFWPAAARLLKANGFFGFLTSSSWLDVEYGFALQGWVLRHFKIIAIMESGAEPWFEDARVKTCITILQRCEDEAQRMTNQVRFVRFKRTLAEIIGTPAGEDELRRQDAINRLKERISTISSNYHDQDLRIILRTQKKLWEDGVRAGSVLGAGAAIAFSDTQDDDEPEGPEKDFASKGIELPKSSLLPGDYCAGKWGRYLRAPDLYFEIMNRFGRKFVPLGEIVDIRFGVKSGCDAFFMPKDMTKKLLDEYQTDRSFRENAGGAPRKDAESGRLRIIQAGDGSVHPIEAQYLAPEVHSPMNVDRPIVRAVDIDRVVLLVSEPLNLLKTKAPWAWRYIKYGSEASFASGKSKPVPLPQRSTCAARNPWYDLTGLVRPGIAFWPMAQQYRHIIAANPEHLICNHNLFDISANELSANERKALVAILNSTLIGLFKTFYGRFAGTEGNLKTEVVDVNLLDIPNPRNISQGLMNKLSGAMKSLMAREIGRLVEEQLMDCHEPERARQIAAGPLVLADELRRPDRQALDDAVFEVLGVHDADERRRYIDRLYEATALHFRDIRVVEIEKMEQRSKSEKSRLNINDLAADIWDAAALEDAVPLRDWLEKQSEANSSISIPEERPVFFPENPLFAIKIVRFGKKGEISREYESSEQAGLVFRLADLGLSGEVRLPKATEPCKLLLLRLNTRIEETDALLLPMIAARTNDERIQKQLSELLRRWFVLGKTQN